MAPLIVLTGEQRGCSFHFNLTCTDWSIPMNTNVALLIVVVLAVVAVAPFIALIVGVALSAVILIVGGSMVWEEIRRAQR